jgi:hypothetical protein
MPPCLIAMKDFSVSKLINANGQQYKSISQACRDAGTTRFKYNTRLKDGCTQEEALNPTRKGNQTHSRPVFGLVDGIRKYYKNTTLASKETGIPVNVLSKRYGRGDAESILFRQYLPKKKPDQAHQGKYTISYCAKHPDFADKPCNLYLCYVYLEDGKRVVKIGVTQQEVSARLSHIKPHKTEIIHTINSSTLVCVILEKGILNTYKDKKYHVVGRKFDGHTELLELNSNPHITEDQYITNLKEILTNFNKYVQLGLT